MHMSDLLTRIEQNDMTITAREIFEHVVVSLLRQGRSSRKQFHPNPKFNAGIRCAYRGDFGAKCSGGWVVPDSLYQPNLESRTIREIMPLLPETLHEHAGLLSSLQAAHDNAAIGLSGQAWRTGLDFSYALIQELTYNAHAFEQWLPTAAEWATSKAEVAAARESWEGYLQSLVRRAQEPVRFTPIDDALPA
jgi:hypothetical protein